jgi:PAS domain S-box-containing protein
MVMSKFLADVIAVANSSYTDDDSLKQFAGSISRSFGLDRSTVMALKPEDQGLSESNLDGYIKNTKRPYIDNQLSDYSAFPELISYKNDGYRSCALVPLVVNGRVISVLELLSKSENKFSEKMMGSIAIGASFMGFAIAYKSEIGKNVRLAEYFDAAFNNYLPQLLVSQDGRIVKLNKIAIKEFDITGVQGIKIPDILNSDVPKLLSQPTNVVTGMAATENSIPKVYVVSAVKISDRLVHIAANNISDAFMNNALMETVRDSKDNCIIVTDSDFKVKEVSANSQIVLGCQRTIMLGGNMAEMLSKGDQREFTSLFEEKKGKAQPAFIHGAFTMVLGDSQPYVHFIGRKFFNGYMFLLGKADAERYIEKVRDDLVDFISSTSDIVIEVDALGNIRDSNIVIEKVLGYKKDELIGKGIATIYQEKEILDRDMTYVRNSGKVDNTFVNLIARDSSFVQAIHSVRMLRSGTDSEGYMIIIKELETKRLLDVLKEDSRSLEGQLKRLRAEGELKSQFIYNISHELKTPLTNIKGFSTLLYNGEFGSLNDEQKEYLKTAIDEADRLMLIIQQVLDAAKLEAEKVKLDMKEVDLQNMSNNPSIKALEESARNKGLEFSWKANFDVPKISADPNRLIQVFVNLIGNAIKFTEKGSIKVDITKAGRSVLCKVIDTGIGISEDDKKKLFRRKFYEATKKGLVQQPGAGTGLGLSITRDIVKLHGGWIKFESKQGEGSTFMFAIPIAPKKKRKEQSQSQPPKPQQPAS